MREAQTFLSEKDDAATARPIRLACRHVWKVYGADADDFFRNGDGNVADTAALIDRLKTAGHIPAACNVSFHVNQGEIFVIMGLSGSGKSTIVRCLSRVVEPTVGEVLIDGEDLLKVTEQELIAIRRHKMGMVFQNFGLLPHLTVLDNVAYPLRVQGIQRAEREERAREVIELVGLTGREASFPRELSGGQQQRVGIARSLAVKPDIWFLDEPFSALDPLIRRQMQDEFLRLQDVLKKTIVFITHDFLEALKLADRMAIMREGQFVQVGRPAQVVLSPADDYVSEFTREVPRAKVLTAGSIAEPAPEARAGAGSVPESLTIEELLPRLVGRSTPLPVADGAGSVIGQITADTVLRALVGDQEEV